MALSKKLVILLLACVLSFADSASNAAPPDFNADRRVNVKCPASIDTTRAKIVHL